MTCGLFDWIGFILCGSIVIFMVFCMVMVARLMMRRDRW